MGGLASRRYPSVAGGLHPASHGALSITGKWWTPVRGSRSDVGLTFRPSIRPHVRAQLPSEPSAPSFSWPYRQHFTPDRPRVGASSAAVDVGP